MLIKVPISMQQNMILSKLIKTNIVIQFFVFDNT